MRQTRTIMNDRRESQTPRRDAPRSRAAPGGIKHVHSRSLTRRGSLPLQRGSSFRLLPACAVRLIRQSGRCTGCASDCMLLAGHVAEWLRTGLQIRLPRFDSGRGLQSSIHPASAPLLDPRPPSVGTARSRARASDGCPHTPETNEKASPRRRNRPTDGEPKCATHISVGSSQNLSKMRRRVWPASFES